MTRIYQNFLSFLQFGLKAHEFSLLDLQLTRHSVNVILLGSHLNGWGRGSNRDHVAKIIICKTDLCLRELVFRNFFQ